MTLALFTEIAGVYDRMNHLLSLGCDLRWRAKAVARVSVRPTHALDLACGTGDFAFALARRFPEATVVGVDLTPAMLDRARAKNRSPRIRFAEGSAERLADAATGLPPGSCELVSCAFGFRNFADPGAALRQVRRMLAPGGELLVLEFFRPRHRLLHAFTAAWVKLLAGLFAPSKGKAYAYLRESMESTVSEEEFVALAARCGFRTVERRFLPPCCSLVRCAAGAA